MSHAEHVMHVSVQFLFHFIVTDSACCSNIACSILTYLIFELKFSRLLCEQFQIYSSLDNGEEITSKEGNREEERTKEEDEEAAQTQEADQDVFSFCCNKQLQQLIIQQL